MRQINAAGEQLIKGFELLKLKGYADQGGVPTIGWGHTGPEVRVGAVITTGEADRLFSLDIAAAAMAVMGGIKVPIGDNQFGALVSFTYNVGVGGFLRSSLRRAVNEERATTVPALFAIWNKVRNPVSKVLEVSNGLIRRRAAEVVLWTLPDTAPASAGLLPTPLSPSVTPAAPVEVTVATSKTLQGLTAATAGTIGAALTDMAGQVQALIPYSDELRWVFLALTLAGLALATYGRFRVASKTGQ